MARISSHQENQNLTFRGNPPVSQVNAPLVSIKIFKPQTGLRQLSDDFGVTNSIHQVSMNILFTETFFGIASTRSQRLVWSSGGFKRQPECLLYCLMPILIDLSRS